MEHITGYVPETIFHRERLYADVEAFAIEHKLEQTLLALPFAKASHQNQYRKGKEHLPFIYHPLTVARQAISLGFVEDELIAAALLHDVCEDCGLAAHELPVNERTQQAVAYLTRSPSPYKHSDSFLKEYYDGISKDRIAIIVKLLDRCHNLSEMAAAFSKLKQLSYIRETEQWIYTLINHLEEDYPEYRSRIFLIKYHIYSVVESIKNNL